MKTQHDRLRWRFLAVRRVFCVMLVVMVAGGLVTPSKACGTTTHQAIVELAYIELRWWHKDIPELLTLLTAYPDAVDSGSVFPDWGYWAASQENNGKYNDFSEIAHNNMDPTYDKYMDISEIEYDEQYTYSMAFLDYMQESISPPYSDYELKTIAFYFGLLSHNVADDAFHGSFVPVAQQMDNSGGGDDHQQIEEGVDAFSAVIGEANDSVAWFFPEEAILAAYRRVGRAGLKEQELTQDNLHHSLTYDMLPLGHIAYTTAIEHLENLHIATAGFYVLRLPWTYNNFDNYPNGGTLNMGNLTAQEWHVAWKKLAPITSIATSPAQPDDNNGWYRQPVTITLGATASFNGQSDTWYSLDGSATYLQYTGPFTISSEGIHSISAYSVDSFGNSGDLENLALQIDWTPPSISGEPTTLPNANGWYNAPVTVHFTAEDALSGLDSLTPDQTLTTEGAGQSVVGVAVDMAGNSSSFTVQPINIDLTPPVVELWVDKPQYTRPEPFIVHFSGSDALSGMSSLTAEFDGQPVVNGQTVDLFGLPLGSYTLTARGEDLAGWVTETSQSIEINATIESLQDTVNRLCQEKSITKSGTCKELSVKLSAAFVAMDRGNTKASANVLKAFQNAVKAQTSKAILDEAVWLLLMDSDYVIKDLSR